MTAETIVRDRFEANYCMVELPDDTINEVRLSCVL